MLGCTYFVQDNVFAVHRFQKVLGIPDVLQKKTPCSCFVLLLLAVKGASNHSASPPHNNDWLMADLSL